LISFINYHSVLLFTILTFNHSLLVQ
jgi:hypothetical protein